MRYAKFARWASPIAVTFAFGAPATAQQLYDVKVSVTETYDTNVSRTSSALAKLRGLQQSDEIFAPQVALDLHKAFGREAAFLTGTTGYDLYNNNRRLNRERIDLNGGLDSPIGPCNTRLAGSIGRHQSDLEELSSSVLTKTTNTLSSTSEGLQTSCGRVVGLTPSFGVSLSQSTNSTKLLRPSDHDLVGANLALGYQRPTLGIVSVYYTYSQATYSNRLFLVGSRILKDEYSVNEAGLRYSRELGARFQANISVGHSSVHNNVPGASPFQGLTYQAGLSFKPSSKLETNFNFERLVTPSNRPNATYSLSERYSIAVDYTVSSRIAASLGVSRTNQHLNGSALVKGVDLTQETIDRIYGTLRVKVGRRLSTGLDVRHDERGANIPGFSYGDTRVGLSLNASY